MNDKLLRRAGEARAEEVLRDRGIGALPVDPVALARRKEILVQPKESLEPGVSGFLMKVGDAFGIGYSTRIDNQGVINFTVAHELGHYFLDGHCEHLLRGTNAVHKSRSGFISDDRFEREADYFAAALLMPEDLFLDALRRAGEGFGAVQTLSAQCRTSITATAIRFAQFAEDPVAVVVSSGTKVEFCFMSDALRAVKGLQWIKKGDSLASRTATAEFNRDPENIAKVRRVEAYSDLDLWFDGAPSVEMKEDVVGLGGYGKTLTVLFTSEPLDDEDGEDQEGEED